MGRYDRIKVYHNGQWKTPTEIKVRSGGAWVSLGTQDGENQTTAGGGVRHLYRYTKARITKEKRGTWIDLPPYNTGQAQINNTRTENGRTVYNYQWMPLDNYSNYYGHSFECTALKADSYDRLLFLIGSTTTGGSLSNLIPDAQNPQLIKIVWHASGQISVRINDDAETVTLYTAAESPLSNNTWYRIKVATEYLSRYGYRLRITVINDDTGVTLLNQYWDLGPLSWAGNNKTHAIGDTNIQFKNTLRIICCSYISNTDTDVQKDMSSNQSIYGFQYAMPSYYHIDWV